MNLKSKKVIRNCISVSRATQLYDAGILFISSTFTNCVVRAKYETYYVEPVAFRFIGVGSVIGRIILCVVK